jgi:hypothetical protein
MPIKKLLEKKANFLKKQITTIMGKLRITLDKENYKPGETILAKINIKLNEPIEARELITRLYCIEIEKVTKTYVMDIDDYRYEKELGMERKTHIAKKTFLVEKIIYNETKKVKGTAKYHDEEIPVEFKIPISAYKTTHEFGVEKRKIIWKIDARLDIPFAFDMKTEKEVIVK